MKKIRAAVVGYGNIGHYSVEALEAAPDFEIAGIVRRQGDSNKPAELAQYDVVDDIAKLKDVDVVVDSIIGTGFNGTLKGNYLKLANFINDLKSVKEKI